VQRAAASGGTSGGGWCSGGRAAVAAGASVGDGALVARWRLARWQCWHRRQRAMRQGAELPQISSRRLSIHAGSKRLPGNLDHLFAEIPLHLIQLVN